MNFGSKYVYKYEHSSDESISDEDECVLSCVSEESEEAKPK